MSAPTLQVGLKAPSSVRRYRDGVTSFAGGQVRQVGRAPVTLAVVIIVWVAGAVTGSLSEGPNDALLFQVGAGVQPLLDGYLWTPLTAAFFATDLITYLLVTVLVLIVGSLVERRWGGVRRWSARPWSRCTGSGRC